jgi:hypothetical protein
LVPTASVIALLVNPEQLAARIVPDNWGLMSAFEGKADMTFCGAKVC